MAIKKFSNAALPDLKLLPYTFLPNKQVRFSKLITSTFHNNTTLHSFSFPKSWMTLSFMMSYFSKTHSLNLVVPEYFCNQTLINLPFPMEDVNYYTLDHHLNPCWKNLSSQCKSDKLNIIILVHFLGYEFNFQRSHAIREKFPCLIVEDCAHQLYPSKEMGNIGDITIFSLHKHIPVDFGAICTLNTTPIIKENLNSMQKSYASYLKNTRKKTNWKWYLIRYIQRFLPYTIYKKLKNTKNTPTTQKKEKMTQLSSFSMSCMIYYLRRINTIKEVKMDLYEKINSTLKKNFPSFELPQFGEKLHIPFYFSFIPPTSIKKLIKICPLMKLHLVWPDLPEIIKNNTSFKIANKYEKELYHLPIHHTQSLKKE